MKIVAAVVLVAALLAVCAFCKLLGDLSRQEEETDTDDLDHTESGSLDQIRRENE